MCPATPLDPQQDGTVVVEPELDRDELQARLPQALAANQPGSGIEHVVVALAS